MLVLVLPRESIAVGELFALLSLPDDIFVGEEEFLPLVSKATVSLPLLEDEDFPIEIISSLGLVVLPSPLDIEINSVFPPPFVKPLVLGA